jgi:glyoxylase-like metal-dependent hydrolase (beta-lactamase superfamily II)
MTDEQSQPAAPANRRTFLRRASLAAATPAVAALVGSVTAAPAHADQATGLPDFAPVPPSALGPALNSAGYFVGQISGNLYWVTDSYYQAMFLTTREGVVVVDAPPTIGANLLRAIESVTAAKGLPSRVTHLIYSHNHADHIGAAALFGEGVQRIGHTETRRLLRIANDPNRPVPTVTFDDRYVLSVGGERLELAYHGPNHSPDNIFIHAPDHSALMVIDVIFPGWTPFKNLAESQDIPGWLDAQQTVLDYSWTTLVAGHLGRLGNRADVAVQQNYLADLQAGARTALTTLDPTPFFEKYGATGNGWAIFKTYLDAVTATAAAPVTAKYLGQLAAADVFTLDNAASMVNSMRIDFDVLGPFGVRQ